MSTKNLLFAILIFLIFSFIVNYSSNDNQLTKRKMLEVDYNAKDYVVTTSISHGEVIKQQIYHDKITSEYNKGYYFFQTGKGDQRKYVQVPINATIIEEVINVDNKK